MDSLRYYPKENADYKSREEPPASVKKILDRVAKAAYDNDRAYEGCTRCVFEALQRELHLEEDENAYRAALKASTGLAAGVARKGETCGALLGAIMAIGLVYGAKYLSEWKEYVKTMDLAGKVFDKFKEKFGTTKCFEIQEKLLGRHYNFWDPKDSEAWYKEGGLDACPGVCATAARIAAEVILENKEFSKAKIE